MKPTRKTSLATAAKAFFLLTGFVAGLTGDVGDSNSPIVVEEIITGLLPILIMPPLIVLLFRFDVAIGAFNPPWEAPSLAGKVTPLSAIQFGSFILAAAGIGATISIAWNGVAAIYAALHIFSGGIALHLALIWLMKLFPPPQTDTQKRQIT